MIRPHWHARLNRNASWSVPRRGVLAAAMFVVAVTAVSSCDRSPAAPSAAGGSVALVRVRIDGPTLIVPGESPRYVAIGEWSDGSTHDLTAVANWQPNNAKYPIHFTSPGIAAPAQRGEVLVTAHAGAIGRLTVLVLDPGTFKLTGLVSEEGVGTLDGATVEVLSGVGQGLRATSDSRGYSLYGLSGPVRLRASADGFAAQIHEVVVTGNEATHAFTLAPAESTADVSGTWTMTLTASSACRAGLPEMYRSRSYQTQLAQQATRLQARLSGPTLQQYPGTYHTGTVLGSRLRFVIAGDTETEEGWSYPSLFDHVSATEQFGFSGSVQGTVNGSDIRSTTMEGDLVYWAAPTGDAAWWCRAKDHVVTFRR